MFQTAKNVHDFISLNENSLLEGSHVFGCTFEDWVKGRKFITNLINQGGTILDIGCANGFLLFCLMYWSMVKLVPYGIDTDSKLIEDAKNLFPQFSNNFVVAGLEDWNHYHKLGLPKKFNIIFWNVWDDFHLDEETIDNLKIFIDSLLEKNGRLILGFYHPYKAHSFKQVNLLKRHLKISEVLENPEGNEVLVCIDKE